MRLQRRDDTLQWTDLEPGKFVVHRHHAKSGLSIRGGLARAAAWAWLFKHYGIKDWLRFIEAYSHPIRLGKYDKGSSKEDRAVLLRAVRNVAGDDAAIIPEGMMIEFIESKGTGPQSKLYHDLLLYFDMQISKAVLGQTLTTDAGQEGSGSYALGTVHEGVKDDIERSDARQLAATLNRDIVRPLVFLNRGMRDKWPMIRIGREEQYDPAMMAEALSKLLPQGLKVKTIEVRERLGFTEPDEGDDVIGGRSEPPPGMPPAQARAWAQAEADRRDAIQRAVDRSLDGDRWEPIMEPLIEPILAAARTSLRPGESLQTFRARLPDLIAGLDDSKLIETLRRLGFTASLSSNAGLEED